MPRWPRIGFATVARWFRGAAVDDGRVDAVQMLDLDMRTRAEGAAVKRALVQDFFHAFTH